MRFVLSLALIAACWWCDVALAQSVEEPLMGSEASQNQSATAEQPGVPEPGADFGGADGIFRILVIGDSLAGGFGAGLARMAQEDARIEVVNRFNEASGLARPEFYDWVAAVPKIVIAKDYDAVVVELGLNDRQDIRSGANQLQFRSNEWVTAYRAQAGGLADKLLSAGLRVYWLAIPPVADPELDADFKFISSLHKEEVQSKGGHFVDLSQYFLGPDGRYSERGPDETGVERKLRARDGITFMRQGNSRFGQLLLAAIKQKEAEGGGPGNVRTPGSALQQDGTEGVTIDVGTALPQFGQEGLEGEQLVFNAAEIKLPTPGAGAPATPVQADLSRLHAANGSAAAKLFTAGEVGVAPAGRFDDYSIPVDQ
jgi:hypothetical protein